MLLIDERVAHQIEQGFRHIQKFGHLSPGAKGTGIALEDVEDEFGGVIWLTPKENAHWLGVIPIEQGVFFAFIEG